METLIQIKLFATLRQFAPPDADKYRIEPGMSIQNLLKQLGIPEKKAKLVFVNGVKVNLTAVLNGGERVGMFPPVGGG